MDQRFEFLRLIGKGSTGGVYEAVCKQTKRKFAIRRFYSDDGEYRKGWEDEFLSIMEHLAEINHPNVVPVIEAALDEDGAYMISEYFPSALLSEKFPDKMDIDSFLLFAEQGISALGALHSVGVVHGRLGYDSFIISRLPNGHMKFVLKDYGLRRIAPMIQGIDPSTRLPTDPVFIAPELFSTGIVEPQTDLYMFGQLCYILLAGYHPMAGKDIDTVAIMHFEHSYKNLYEQDPNIPGAISKWVDYLTQPDAENRPESAVDALAALKQYQLPKL